MIYFIEFTMFDGVLWAEARIEIYAPSLDQLQEVVYDILERMSEYVNTNTGRAVSKSKEQKWEEIKPHIQKITNPIVKQWIINGT